MRFVESQCQYDFEVNCCANLTTLVEIFAPTFRGINLHIARCNLRVCDRVSAQKLMHSVSREVGLMEECAATMGQRVSQCEPLTLNPVLFAKFPALLESCLDAVHPPLGAKIEETGLPDHHASESAAEIAKRSEAAQPPTRIEPPVASRPGSVNAGNSLIAIRYTVANCDGIKACA
jgi:hypothetical protein